MHKIANALNVEIEYFKDDYYSFVLSDSYCKFLKNWRKGLKVKELQKMLGVSFAAYLGWENGQRMSRNMFNKIRHKLGI